MNIGDLIEALPPELEIEYEGDRNAPFKGFTTVSPKRRSDGIFLVVSDDSWPPRPNQSNTTSSAKAERVIKRAFERGIAGIICGPTFRKTPMLKNRNVLLAKDTYAVVCAMAKVVQTSLESQRITAITGSAGKTTTKAMLVHALRGAGIRTVATNSGSRNIYKQALRLMCQAHESDHTVIEVAGSAFNVFRTNSFTISPDVSIITSISEAHLEYLHDLEGVAQIKSDLFQSPPAGGTAIINLDTSYSDLLIRRAIHEGCQLVTYGKTNEATVELLDFDGSTGRVMARVGKERIEYSVGTGVEHYAMNSLAVISALRALRVKSWREGIQSLASFSPLRGRGNSIQLKLNRGGEFTLVDESFNANPASIKSALDSLRTLTIPEGSRRIAVLGDVLELGEGADEVHRGMAGSVLRANLDEVFLFGEHMGALAKELSAQGSQVRHWESLEALKGDLFDLLKSQDVVLMKASGATGLKQYVRELIEAETHAVSGKNVNNGMPK